MTKINFNPSSVQNSVLPNLNNAIDTLNVVINKGSQLSIPRNFSYYSKLNEIQTSNIECKKSLLNIKNYIDKSSKNFDGAMSEINNELEAINNVQIKKRGSSIK